MPGLLLHSPADVIAQLLVDLGVCVAAPMTDEVGDEWSAYVNVEPDRPDNCVTVYDTTGRNSGRTAPESTRLIQHGTNIRVRCADRPTGYAKAHAIAIALDGARLEFVVLGEETYRVWCYTRNGDVIIAGREPNSQRSIYTINGVASIRKMTGAVDTWVTEDAEVVTEDGDEVLL